MLVHALWYAEHGYHVLPLRSETNLADSRLLGHGWRYTEDSPGTRDPEKIISWWRQDPSANIGIQSIGCVCLDIDNKPGKVNGNESLFNLMSEYDASFPTEPGATEDTPNFGAHVWLGLEDDEDGRPGMIKKRDGWLPGVDVSGYNSLVAVAPSHRERRGFDQKDGHWIAQVPYVWRSTPPLPRWKLPLMQKWMLNDILTRPVGSGRSGGGSGSGGGVGNGGGIPPTSYFLEHGFGTWDGSTGRNRDCYLVACRLWHTTNMDRDIVMATIYDIWLKTPGHDKPKVDDGFPWDEACGAVKSAYFFIRDRRAEESRRAGGSR